MITLGLASFLNSSVVTFRRAPSDSNSEMSRVMTSETSGL